MRARSSLKRTSSQQFFINFLFGLLEGNISSLLAKSLLFLFTNDFHDLICYFTHISIAIALTHYYVRLVYFSSRNFCTFYLWAMLTSFLTFATIQKFT